MERFSFHQLSKGTNGSIFKVVCVCVCVCVHMCMFVFVYVCVCRHIYI